MKQDDMVFGREKNAAQEKLVKRALAAAQALADESPYAAYKAFGRELVTLIQVRTSVE